MSEQLPSEECLGHMSRCHVRDGSGICPNCKQPVAAAEPVTKDTQSIDLLERLREELEKRSFHPGEWDQFKHIEYCDYCHYSREYIARAGHGEGCLLRKRS